MAAKNLDSTKSASLVRSRVTAENSAAEPTETSIVTELKTVPTNPLSTESGNELSAEIRRIAASEETQIRAERLAELARIRSIKNLD